MTGLHRHSDSQSQEETKGHPDGTARLHHPGGGVTLGPGYDMSGRTQDQVRRDLEQIGVDHATAETLSRGARLFGPEAEAFVKRHRFDLTLTLAQQHALLDLALPACEAEVRRTIHAPLTQNQFDALVSFDYARGERNLLGIAAAINAGHPARADEQIRHFDDNADRGRQTRRAAEADMFGNPIGKQAP